MPSLGDLVASLKLDASGFKGGLDTAQAGLTRFGHEARNIFLGMAGGFGAERIFENVTQQIEQATALGHTAEKLDIPVNSLIALQHQATLAHVEVDKLVGGIEKMQKNLFEAEATGANAGVFKMLGVDLDSIIDKGADEQFAQIAEGISKLEDPTARAEAAFKVFGKGGIELMTILREGRGGIEEARGAIHRMGLELSAVDAAKLHEADRAMKMLGETWSAFWRSAAADGAPVLTAFLNSVNLWWAKWTRLANFISDLGEPEGNRSGDKLAAEAKGHASIAKLLAEQEANEKAIGDAAERSKSLYEETRTPVEKLWEKFEEGEALANDGMLDLETEFRLLGAAVDEANKPADELFESIRKTGAALDEEFRTPLESAVDKFLEVEESFNRGASSAETYARAYAKIGEESRAANLKRHKDEIDDINDAMQEAARIFDETRTPVEKFADEIDRLNELWSEGALDDDTFVRGLGQAQSKLDSTKPEQKPLGERGKLEFQDIRSREGASAVLQALNNRDFDAALLTANNTGQANRHLQQIAAGVAKIGGPAPVANLLAGAP